MTRLETQLLNFLFKPKQKEVKSNTIIDLDKLKYERILRLREIAQKEHNHAKFHQANRLLTEITQRLNNRFHNCNRFNFN